jgi:hypothetical protein
MTTELVDRIIAYEQGNGRKNLPAAYNWFYSFGGQTYKSSIIGSSLSSWP